MQRQLPMELKYQTQEKLTLERPVAKYEWIEAQCAGHDVIDLGCLDETALDEKQGTPWWLHGRIAAVAARTVGIDNSVRVPEKGMSTGPRSTIMRGDVLRLDELDLPFRPDVVVAGELIEHILDPVAFLMHLRQVPALRGARLIATTPNATALYQTAFALTGRECQHADHVMVQSFKTLNTICNRAGLEHFRIIPHQTCFPEQEVSSTGVRRMALMAFTKGLNIAAARRPLLAGGWIIDTVLA